MLRILFYTLIVKPLVLIVLGINVRDRHHLPCSGPAIIVANHNSHLDTLALMSMIPVRLINQVHPVAAADYFLKNRVLRWFALNIVGIIPIERKPSEKNRHVLAPVIEALDKGLILILFPEGTRGQPESMGKLKNGLARLISERPDVPVIPIFFYGLGKSLPKGEFILVPFFIDAFVGAPLLWEGSRQLFMEKLALRMNELRCKAVKATEAMED